MSSDVDALAQPIDVRETLAAIALGANLGDRLGTLRAAVGQLCARTDVAVIAQSSVYDTEPLGSADQPRYLNAAVLLRTSLEPLALLRVLLEIERALGRTRGEDRWMSRSIDLDLILMSECVLNAEDLVLPHPRFRERAFVLLPLFEIAPSMHDPITGKSVESLLRACPGRSDAVRTGPLAVET